MKKKIIVLIVISIVMLCIVGKGYINYKNSYNGSQTILSTHIDDFNTVTSYVVENYNNSLLCTYDIYGNLYVWDNGASEPFPYNNLDKSTQSSFYSLHRQRVNYLKYVPNKYILYIFRSTWDDSTGFAYVLDDEALNETTEGETLSFTSFKDVNLKNWYYYEDHTIDR